MLLETYDWGLDPRQLQLLFGLAIGLIFGIAAQITRFCLRRAVAGSADEQGPAAAVWLTALATAIVGFQMSDLFGLTDVTDHRFLSNDLPILAILIGGVAFGIGMVLTRGCVSRLTVLGASGNFRALTVLAIFAIVAHAMLKGVFAPLRTGIGSVSTEIPFASLAVIPGGAPLAALAVVVAAVMIIRRHRPSVWSVLLGGVIGLVPVLGWATTSVLLYDDFDPLVIQSAAFTLPWSDTLFWVIASSAIPAGFGTGLVGGVLLGSFASAAIRKELKLVSFESPAQTVRYAAGAALMGAGGVLAGGCTVGAGLSGAATLSVAALLALLSIVAGALIATRVLNASLVAEPA